MILIHFFCGLLVSGEYQNVELNYFHSLYLFKEILKEVKSKFGKEISIRFCITNASSYIVFRDVKIRY